MQDSNSDIELGARMERERLAKVALTAPGFRNEEESRLAREFAAAGEVAEKRRIKDLFKDRIANQDNVEAAEWAIEVINSSTDFRYLS